ncbi:MAG TPA: restriction endonuclease subunit S [Paludibacter sp.]|nr:restriction endonuclease subunit S [Paludibacter sp.]
MIKYENYKPSGIEWLGEIPEHWEVKRIKDLGSLQNGISNGKDYFGFGSPFVSYGNIYNNTVELNLISTLANSTKADQKLYSVLEGDIFFTRTSETINEIGISATCKKTIPKATFSGFVIRFRPYRNRITKEFSDYFFKAHINRLFLSKEISLVTRASLGQGILNNLPVLILPVSEQIAIAQYLDSKTQTIDKKIDILTRKTSLYKNLRKSIINDAVCRGLEKNTKLKDCGIDLIGLIPEHWEVKRIKDNYTLFTGNSISDKSLFENKANSIDYVSTKDIDVNTCNINYDNGVYIPKSDKGFKIAKKNSILLCLEGANAGKKIGYTEKDICFVNKLCSIKSINKNSLDKYLFYYIQSPLFERQFFATLNGLIGGVSLSSVKYFDVVEPTKEEQTKITEYLDEKTQKIDCILDNIQNQIATLKELRKSLINDVVTGKIKVTV